MGVRLPVPKESQRKEKDCVSTCLAMGFQYDGLDLKPGDVRAIHDKHYNSLQNDIHGTSRSEIAEALNAVNREYETNYHGKFFVDNDRIVENGDSHTHRDVYKKIQEEGHEVRNGLPPFRRRKVDGEVSVQEQIEDRRTPPMLWRDGHAVLATGTDERGGLLKHDPQIDMKHYPVLPKEERKVTDVIVIRDES